MSNVEYKVGFNEVRSNEPQGAQNRDLPGFQWHGR